MNELFASITKELRSYFDPLLVRNESGYLSILDNKLNDFASCCTVGEVASFYLVDYLLHNGDGQNIAKELIKDVFNRQLENGAFGQPYYVKKGEASTVDIAEIGAVANALYHIYRMTNSSEAKKTLLNSADYLISQVARENPGAVYKNPQAKNHDVLNGDIYAAHTWGRAFELTNLPIYHEKMIGVLEHVSRRFGKHMSGWWPYIENWDGSVGMGNSVSYQGTIIAFAHTCKSHLHNELLLEWNRIETEALKTMVTAMEHPPNDDTEAPWWCRDWENTWEIYLSFWRKQDEEVYYKKVLQRLERVNEDLKHKGGNIFTPRNIHHDPERSPVTTTFRKAATFAGIFSYMMLDRCTSQ